MLEDAILAQRVPVHPTWTWNKALVPRAFYKSSCRRKKIHIIVPQNRQFNPNRILKHEGYI